MALVLGGMLALAAPAQSQMNSADLKWAPAPPVFPAGAQMAVLSGDPGNPSAGMIRAVPGLGEIGLPIERDRVNWAAGRVPRRSHPPGFRRPRAGTGEFHPADTTTQAEKGSVPIPVIPQESDWL